MLRIITGLLGFALKIQHPHLKNQLVQEIQGYAAIIELKFP